jgi:hypothetical protein
VGEPGRHERVLDDVGGGVGRGKGDGDDEVRQGEPEQHQHEDLASPARQQLFEHGDAALAVRAALGNLTIDGQGHREGNRHQDQGGDRREDARGQERDGGLVAERRKVIDAGQAHHAPPRILMMSGFRRDVGPFQQPCAQGPSAAGSRRLIGNALAVVGVQHGIGATRQGLFRHEAPIAGGVS